MIFTIRNTAIKKLKKTVLFIITAIGYFKEASPVCKKFSKNNWKVIILVGFYDHNIDSIKIFAKKNNLELFYLPKDLVYSDYTNNFLSSYVKKNIFSIPIRLLSLLYLVKRNLKKKKRIISILKSFKPDCVFMGSFHSSGEIDNIALKYFKKSDKNCYCIPNSDYLGEKVLIDSRENFLSLGTISNIIKKDFDVINKIFALFFNSWVRNIKKNKVFFWDPIKIIADKLVGIGMEKNWMKPSILFDKVFVFSKISRRMLISDGYPDEKIIVSGQPFIDNIRQKQFNEKFKKKMMGYLNVRDGKFLLLNVEPSAEHNYCEWSHHWDNFNKVLINLKQNNLPIVLSLHPLCNYEDYKFAEKKYKVKICRNYSIHELYPFCKAVVSFPCSTNFLSLIFNKPLIIYDLFNISKGCEKIKIHKIKDSKIVYSASELFPLKIKNNKKEQSKNQKYSLDIIFKYINEDLDSKRIKK